MGDITLEDKKPEILRAIEYAKTKGVTAIKIELEAQFDRDDDDSDECEYCDEGRTTCGNCDGYGRSSCPEGCDYGTIEDDEGNSIACLNEECLEGNVPCTAGCDDGSFTCDECDGNWEHVNDDAWSNSRCLNYILDAVGITDGNDSAYYQPENPDWLQFAKFYNDGSVDSEMTFTIRLDNPENIFKALPVITAFRSLADRIGNDINTEGAGMHVAWLFTEDCSYPLSYAVDAYRGVRNHMTNFRRAMGLMMPALFFLAAPANGDNWTRGFGYRAPKVGFDGEKYSAIYFANGAMEFRVFDTCYDTPEQILDNVVVMSNCLKYFNATYNGPKVTINSYGFGNEANRSLDRLYYEENTLDLLYKHIGKLKPKYYTMRMLRQQRAFKMSKKTIKSRSEAIRRNAELAWEELNDRLNVVQTFENEEIRMQMMRNFVERTPISMLRRMTEEQIAEAVKAEVNNELTRRKNNRPLKENFVSERVRHMLEELRPRYTVNLT